MLDLHAHECKQERRELSENYQRLPVTKSSGRKAGWPGDIVLNSAQPEKEKMPL